MPDMEERLMKEFDLKRADERWLTAWDLRDKAKGKPADKPTRSKPTSPRKVTPEKAPAEKEAVPS